MPDISLGIDLTVPLSTTCCVQKNKILKISTYLTTGLLTIICFVVFIHAEMKKIINGLGYVEDADTH